MPTLHDAAQKGDVALIRKLLAKGDVNAKDADGATALQHAALRGNVDAVRALLEAGIDAKAGNNLGYTPLMVAARGGCTEIVTTLLGKGVPVDAQDNEGFTALLFAAGYSPKTETARVLAKAGANVNRGATSGATPLMWACGRGSKDMVLELLALGADPAVVDGQGKTAADWAVRRNHPELVDLLRKKA